MLVRLKQSTPVVVQAIPQPSQANPEVKFNREWLAEKISDNLDNLIECRLSARGIVTDNHSANVNAFPAQKTAMGIDSGIWQYHRKCSPVLVLWQQKKCCCKGFHISGLSFQVLQCC